MATPLYGLNATKRDVSVPSQKIDALDVFGKVRVAYDEYTSTAAVIALNEEILMQKIPKGARILDAWFYGDDHGTTGTLTVGWKASADGLEVEDANGLFDTVDVKTAAVMELMSADKAHAGIFKKLLAEVQAFIKITEATDASAGKSFKLAIAFAVE